ncbi:MAG TPA: polysaccharide deacetylase family protein [Kofleriaceae bacterium]|nr:polysaccharide deacetylase family protein [Kofleriaceae bacterium]
MSAPGDPARRRRWKRRAAISCAALILLGSGLFGLHKLANARGFQLFGDIVDRVETDDRVVALTFDDGPADGRTQEVLRILARHGVAATFFLIGRDIDANPEAARAIAAAGHQIGNHTYTHPRMVFLRPSTIRDEVERTETAIRRTGHRGPIVFRPPFGKKLFYLPYYLDQRGIKTIMWDVEPDSHPEVAATADGIVRHVVERVRPGSIILLHVMAASRETSFRAVEPMVVELERLGYRFVTVDQLLALEAGGSRSENTAPPPSRSR